MSKRFGTILALSATLLAGVVEVSSALTVPATSEIVRAQVTAAAANAAASLKADVLASHITPDLTVSEFLDKTGSTAALDELVGRARQIGGPRWLDDQTCQVKLEVSGARVAYMIVSTAAVKPKLSPMPAAVLEQRLSDLKARTYTATGTSVSSDHIEGVRPIPDASDSWAHVSDAARGQAVSAARRDAVHHVIDSIRPIELGPGQTLGDAMNRESVRSAVDEWLASRPVTEVNFRDDLQVELTVSTPSDDLFDAVVNSLKSDPSVKLPSDEGSLAALRQEFSKRVASVIGRAGVEQGGDVPKETAAHTGGELKLSDQPPSWLTRGIDADATSKSTGARLRTARAAESEALENLRARIGALTVGSDQTLNDLAKSDPRIDAAIKRAMLRARTSKVDYLADGSAAVRVTIDPRDVWDELQQALAQ